MKRLTVLLVALLLVTSTTVYGNSDDKLINHWANSQIDRSFMAYYFPYLVRDNYGKFEPNSTILEQDFYLSLASLFKDYGYDIEIAGVSISISRKDVVNIIGNELLKIGLKNEENVNIPFKDVNTMASESIELLRLLYKYKIFVGDSNNEFFPDRNLSQAEAIIILQRAKGVLEEMNTIAFKTLGIVQTYNNQEAMIVTTNEDKVIVTITKEFGTPGYSMSIDKILRDREGYKVYFNIIPPRVDAILPQVITYKTITVEIDKSLLGNPPYNFILEGYNRVLVRPNF